MRKWRAIYVNTDPLIGIMLVILGLWGMAGPNPLLTLGCLVSIPIYIQLLWRKAEPPVLFFAVLYQWLQVSTKVFHANVINLPIVQMFGNRSIETAIWLGLAGLLALGAGMRIALSGCRGISPASLHQEVIQLSVDRLFVGYLVMFVASLVMQGLIWKLPQITQFLYALFNLKWVLFFALALTVMLRKIRWIKLTIATGLELLIGFIGFFSDFKQVFFVLFVVALTVGYRMSPKNILRASLVGGVVIFLGILWSSVKGEYRSYINQGTGQQVVTVSVSERLSKLTDLFMSIDASAFRDGFERLAERIAYVDYFANVLENVPARIPFEGGALWRKALEHIFMPRLFFPNKPPLEFDSELTMKYTMMEMAGGEQGTSVSMGYMAENYIDFGPAVMFGPIFLTGMIWGLMYRWLLKNTRSIVFGYAFVVSVLINANQFEIHNVKLIGSMISCFLVMSVLMKFVMPFLYLWFRKTLPKA